MDDKLIYLSHIPSYTATSEADRVVSMLYREYNGIPDDVEVDVSDATAFGTIMQHLEFDIDTAVKSLGKSVPLKAYNYRALQAHMLTRVVLEDLYQNEDVDPSYYPTEWTSEDDLEAIMNEFDIGA